jgi:hypothetical protein
VQQALVYRGEQLKALEARCDNHTTKVLLSRLIRPLWAQLDEATKVYENVQKAIKNLSKQGKQRKPK